MNGGTPAKEKRNTVKKNKLKLSKLKVLKENKVLNFNNTLDFIIQKTPNNVKLYKNI